MNHTTNYNLNQWEADDRVQRTDFNADNAKIDAAIAAADAKADALAGSKADKTALAALQTAMNAKGNCQIVTGQYTGTGQRGASVPNSLTFDHKPLVLLISGGNVMISARDGLGYILNNGASQYLTVIWGDKSVSWYTDTIDAGPSRQMNMSGVVYTYVVLLEI